MEPALWKLRLFTYCVFLFQSGFSSAVTGPSEVTGNLGGSLSVRCHYGRMYGSFNKYWCEGWTSLCSTRVTSTKNQRHVRKDRISISDDPASHSFTVTMKALREEDAGWYQCGISITGSDLMFTLKVTVLPAATTVKTRRSTKTTTYSTTSTTTTAVIPQDPTVYSFGGITDGNAVPTHPNSSTAIYTTSNIPSAQSFSSGWILSSLLISSVLLLLLVVLAPVCFNRRKSKRRLAAKSEAHNGETAFSDTDSAAKIEITYTTIRFGGPEQQQHHGTRIQPTSQDCVYSTIMKDQFHQPSPQEAEMRYA